MVLFLVLICVVSLVYFMFFCFFFFQAEDGIRDAQESRGLGDVYKRQDQELCIADWSEAAPIVLRENLSTARDVQELARRLSLIHI